MSEWMTLVELEPGTLFETEDGIRAVKSDYHIELGKCECVLLSSGEYAHFGFDAATHNSTRVRPLPSPLSPNDQQAARDELRQILDSMHSPPIIIQPVDAHMDMTPEQMQSICDALDAMTTSPVVIAESRRGREWNPRTAIDRLGWLLGLSEDERSFVRHLASHPGDKDHIGVFADWLADQGREADQKAMLETRRDWRERLLILMHDWCGAMNERGVRHLDIAKEIRELLGMESADSTVTSATT